MCQYQFFYYGGCRHARTVLVNFCEKAEPIALSTIAETQLQQRGWWTTEQSQARQKPRAKAQMKGSRDRPWGKSKKGKQAATAQRLPSPAPFPPPKHRSSSPIKPLLILDSSAEKADLSSAPSSVTTKPSQKQQTIRKHRRHSDPLPLPSTSLADMPPIGATLGLRHWMGGGSPKQGHASVAVSQGHKTGASSEIYSRRSHQPGIRQGTDESFDLPNSYEIIQHISESSRDIDNQYVVVDGHRTTSYGTTVTDSLEEEKPGETPIQNPANKAAENEPRGSTKRAMSEAASEVDPSLKSSVEQADWRKTEVEDAYVKPTERSGLATVESITVTPQQDTAKRTCDVDRTSKGSGKELDNEKGRPLPLGDEMKFSKRIPPPTPMESFWDELMRTEPSPAARMMLWRERIDRDGLDKIDEPTPQPQPPTPPGPADFPELSNTGSRILKSTGDVCQAKVPRKPSYASVLTAGVKHAATAPKSSEKLPSTHPRAEDKAPAAVSTQNENESGSQFQRSQICARDPLVLVPRGTVAISELSTNSTASGNGKRSATNGKSENFSTSPHFAQPTQSFSRRAGEIARAHSVTAAPPRAMTVSPSKNVRVKELELYSGVSDHPEKEDQHRHKRGGLPDHWIPSSPNKAGSTNLAAPSRDEPVLQVPGKGWQTKKGMMPRSPKLKKSSTIVSKNPENSDEQLSPKSDKKSSSYMSPTEATTLRTVAILGRKNAHCGAADPQQIGPSSDSNKTVTSSPERISDVMPCSPSGHSTPTRPAERIAELSPNTTAKLKHVAFESSPIKDDNNGADGFGHSPRTPSRIPRIRGGISGPQKIGKIEDSTDRNDCQEGPRAVTGLKVEGTTVVRTNPRDEVLRPIYAKLEKSGLRKRRSTDAGLSSTQSLRSVAAVATDKDGKSSTEEAPRWSTAQQLSMQNRAPETSGELSEYVSDGAVTVSPEATSISGLNTVIPVSEISTAKTNSVNLRQHPATASNSALSLHDQDATTARAASRSRNGLASDATKESRTSADQKATSSASLRATAKEFTPTHKGQQPAGVWGREANLGAFSDTSGPGGPVNNRQRRRMTPWHATARGSWGNPMVQSAGIGGNNVSCSRQSAPDSTYTPYRPFTDMRSSALSQVEGGSNQVAVGHAPEAMARGGQKVVQWMHEDNAGIRRPVSFGRAAAPPLESSSISPNSDETNVEQTPQKARSWTIGAAGKLVPFYVWKGGDGKEISFSGYGPHAEMHPNNPVRFRYGKSVSRAPPGRSIKNSHSPDSIAHMRSPGYWAAFGYNKIPCGDMEITQAVEILPTAMGYCGDCSGLPGNVSWC